MFHRKIQLSPCKRDSGGNSGRVFERNAVGSLGTRVMRRFIRTFPLRLTGLMLRFMGVGTNLRLSTWFLLLSTYGSGKLTMSLSVKNEV